MSRERLVVAIFVLSGAAGLIYEIVWARQLVIVFGNTTQAVTTILTAFFGGMALGSLLGGRMADRVKDALRFYGLLELVVAGMAILTPLSFGLIAEAYRGAYPSLVDVPGALGLVRFVLAIIVLAPATVLMGATLPALTRYLRAEGRGLSGAFSRLYAANLIGAIVGTAAAGMVLIELLGLTGSLVVGAVCSAVAGAVAVLLSGSPGPTAGPASPGMEASAPPVRIPLAPRPGLALALAFTSGLTSLGYQVLWFRLVGSGTGGSTYVFTLILVLFLGGLALGARIVASGRFARSEALQVIAIGQAVVALLAVAGLLVLSFASQVPWAILAVVVVLPAATVLGITFPVSSALLPDRSGHVAGESGGLLAANTTGAIAGSALIPFVAVPAIGSSTAVAVVAVVNAAIALAVGWAWLRERGSDRPSSAGLAGLAVVLILVIVALPLVRDPALARIQHTGARVLAASEDEIAAVHAGVVDGDPRLWVAGTSMTTLTVDARLMAVLPIAARPESRSMLVVAFGMGSTFRSALIAGLDVDAVELVPSVPAMFPLYFADAEEVLADPRGHIAIADGRNYVELTERTYDIIVVDPPPPPESSGVSVISSLEFYRAAAKRLTPGGLMMQWVPFWQSVDDIRTHIRTFASSFEHVMILTGVSGAGIFMFGSKEPVDISPEAIQSTLARPGVLDDLMAASDSPAKSRAEWERVIPSLKWLEGPEVDRFAGAGPMVTDDRPIPEYYALRRALAPPSGAASAEALRALAP